MAGPRREETVDGDLPLPLAANERRQPITRPRARTTNQSIASPNVSCPTRIGVGTPAGAAVTGRYQQVWSVPAGMNDRWVRRRGDAAPAEEAAVELVDRPRAAQRHRHAHLVGQDVDAVADAGLAGRGQPV